MEPPDPVLPFLSQTVLVGIAGGTGSGKTTVAKKILEQMPEGQAALIQHDWYYRDHPGFSPAERERLNYDEPAALDNDLLVSHLEGLRHGASVDCPRYDFATHSRKAETVRVEPCRIVVVEGILVFSVPVLRELFDLRLYVETADDVRLMRRIRRDLLTRGRDINSIQAQYYDTVRPMHELHVAPNRVHAHLIIPEGGENRHAIDVVVGCLLHGLSRR
jgi:uridine kinase